MRIGFAPDNETDDAEILDLGVGGAEGVPDEEADEDPGNLAYVAAQLGPFTFEWRLHR